MAIKIISGDKIDLFELYNFGVHQIYVVRWHYNTKFNWKYFPIYLQYISGVTSTSPSLSDGVVHFELTVSTAQLLSSMKPFSWYTYWGFSRGCLQLHFQQFRWRWYQNTNFGFGLRGPNYPRDDLERSPIKLWIIKPN